jgi:hypothetical protein
MNTAVRSSYLAPNHHEDESIILKRIYRFLRRIFGPKKDEVIREWRKLHNEELNDLYSSPIIFRWKN